MSTTVDREAEKVREQDLIKKLQGTRTIKDCRKVFEEKEDILSSEILDVYVDHMDSLMRERIASIKTPKDVLDAHNFFKGHNVFHTKIQKELGKKAEEIFGSWHPESHRAGVGVHWK
jgi:hypothetical protein